MTPKPPTALTGLCGTIVLTGISELFIPLRGNIDYLNNTVYLYIGC